MKKFKNQNIFVAAKNALNGFSVLIKDYSARREILLIFISLIVYIYDKNIYTLIIFILTLILLSVESLNSAIEQTCDLISIKKNIKIKKIKDLGATAVFIIICSIIFVGIGYLFSLIN
jgi:diacylglycerol kinase (ATP)